VYRESCALPYTQRDTAHYTFVKGNTDTHMMINIAAIITIYYNICVCVCVSGKVRLTTDDPC